MYIYHTALVWKHHSSINCKETAPGHGSLLSVQRSRLRKLADLYSIGYKCFYAYKRFVSPPFIWSACWCVIYEVSSMNVLGQKIEKYLPWKKAQCFFVSKQLIGSLTRRGEEEIWYAYMEAKGRKIGDCDRQAHSVVQWWNWVIPLSPGQIPAISCFLFRENVSLKGKA